MILKSVAYAEFEGTPREWVLEETTLQLVNLLVGRNASGKSWTLNVISGLAKLMTGQQVFPMSGNYSMNYSEGQQIWQYELQVKDRKVIAEKVRRDRKVLLERRPGGYGQIFLERDGKDTEFQTPDTSVAVFARQDLIQSKLLILLP